MKKDYLVTLEAPDEKPIRLNYYELPEKCYELCRNYQLLGEKQKEEVRAYCNNRPSYVYKEVEFIQFHQEYWINHPVLLKKWGIPYQGNLHLTKNKKELPTITNLGSFSFSNHSLEYVSFSNPKNTKATSGFIDPEGGIVNDTKKVSQSSFIGHRQVARAILHHYLMASREHCQDYFEYQKQEKADLNREVLYLWKLGFVPYSEAGYDGMEHALSWGIQLNEKQEKAFQKLK